MEDNFEDVNNCRKYLKYLDEIRDIIEILPSIDDASEDFYYCINASIENEDIRVTKKLKRLESDKKCVTKQITVADKKN